VLAKTASSVASLPASAVEEHLRSPSAALFILMTVAAYGGFVGISVTHALSSGEMNTYGGHAYTVDTPTSDRLWPLHSDSDAPDRTGASSARILEDGAKLGPVHSIHARIVEVGAGACSHCDDAVHFSASDTRPTSWP